MSPKSTVPGVARNSFVKRLPLYAVVKAITPTASSAGTQPSSANACGRSHRLGGRCERGGGAGRGRVQVVLGPLCGLAKYRAVVAELALAANANPSHI
jgi:hypothetical protein